MNFEGIIAIINLNQWFITAIMWSFLLMVSRAACAIAMKIFVVAGKSEGRPSRSCPHLRVTRCVCVGQRTPRGLLAALLSSRGARCEARSQRFLSSLCGPPWLQTQWSAGLGDAWMCPWWRLRMRIWFKMVLLLVGWWLGGRNDHLLKGMNEWMNEWICVWSAVSDSMQPHGL